VAERFPWGIASRKEGVMGKKLWIGFIVVFILMSILSVLIHDVILGSKYQSDEMKSIWRPDMQSKMWIYFLVYVFVSFFFTLIFSYGYEGKGIMEGVRYGIYMGFLMGVPMGYSTYAMFPIPYSVALTWFLTALIQYIILGAVLAAIYGKKPGRMKA
jgi:hypothetical protein